MLGAFGWGTFAAALVPTVAIGFNWKRATATAANVAIVTGLVVNFGIELFDLAIPYGINGGFVALLLSMTLFFGISLASPPPVLDPEHRGGNGPLAGWHELSACAKEAGDRRGGRRQEEAGGLA